VRDTISRIQNYSWKVKEKEKLVIARRHRVSTYSVFSTVTRNNKDAHVTIASVIAVTEELLT